MAGGKEELAAMLHGSVGQKDGFGLEGFGEEVKIKVGDTPMRVGLHCSMASFSVHIPVRFHSLQICCCFVFGRHIAHHMSYIIRGCAAVKGEKHIICTKILHNSLRLVRGLTALAVSRGTLHIPGLKQMQNLEFRVGAEQRRNETTRASLFSSTPPPNITH